jgi:cell division protein FtsB
MKLSYSDMRRFDDKLDRIETAVTSELAALRARIAELEGQIAAAVDATDAVEKGARDGLPAAP